MIYLILMLYCMVATLIMFLCIKFMDEDLFYDFLPLIIIGTAFWIIVIPALIGIILPLYLLGTT